MLKPAIIDHDPFDILAYRRRVELLGSHHFAHSYNIAAAAIEIALWDIVGKAWGSRSTTCSVASNASRVPTTGICP